MNITDRKKPAMTEQMVKFIKNSKKDKEHYDTLTGEEKKKVHKQLENLSDRMQSEENVEIIRSTNKQSSKT